MVTEYCEQQRLNSDGQLKYEHGSRECAVKHEI